MLPNEMAKLLGAMNESKGAHVDVAQLRSELAGTAVFYHALVAKGLLTDQQRELFAEHVGRHIGFQTRLLHHGPGCGAAVEAAIAGFGRGQR